MRSRLGMSAYYKKRRVGGRTSHLARGDRVPIHLQLLTYYRSYTYLSTLSVCGIPALFAPTDKERTKRLTR